MEFGLEPSLLTIPDTVWWTVIPESFSAIIVLFCDFEFGENFLQIPQFQALNWWSDAVFETYCGEETHAFNNLIQILNWIALFSVPCAKTTLTGKKKVEEEKNAKRQLYYLLYLNTENSLFIILYQQSFTLSNQS